MQQQQSDMNIWIQFFKDASIPPQFANKYAAIFTKNRIRFDMLADIDKNLLNEMGINAIGDVLSILKHSKIINTKLEEKKSFKSNINRCEVAKRIIETYLGDQQPNSTNLSSSGSGLSSDLVSRLNFLNPVKVTFNEESLSKVIVSSTTNDHDFNDMSPKKFKRKLTEDDSEEEIDDDDGDHAPLEYRGYLKNENKIMKTNSIKQKPSIDSSLIIKLNNKPVKSRLSMPSSIPFQTNNAKRLTIKINADINKNTTNETRLNTSLESSLNKIKNSLNDNYNQPEKRESVFKRIKLNNNIQKNENSKNIVKGQIGLIKKTIQNKNISTAASDVKITKIIPISFDSNKTANNSANASNQVKKVINLKSIKANGTNMNDKKKLFDRLKFNK